MKTLLTVGVLCATLNLWAGVSNDSDLDQAFMQEGREIMTGDISFAQSQKQEPQQMALINKQTDSPVLSVQYTTGSQSNYFEEAGKYYNVDPRLLWCVAKVESNHNPYAVGKNTNGTYDIGLMQINTVHLKGLARHGITKNMLFDPKTNVYVGAWVMAGCIAKHGMTKNGITCYNGRIKDNPYGDKVLKVFYQQEARYAFR